MFPINCICLPSEVNDVSCYIYTTTSKEEMVKIHKQKMNGLTTIQVEVIAKEKNNTEWTALTLAAIEDAKVKAQKIANHPQSNKSEECKKRQVEIDTKLPEFDIILL